MVSVGKLYADVINYPIYRSKFIIEHGWTNETDTPFRHGKCLVIKPCGLTKAMVIGLWGKPQAEENALANAIQARELDTSTEEIMEW